MEDTNTKQRLSDTEPYQAIAKTVLDTAIEDDLELPEVLRAIRTAFIDFAYARAVSMDQEIQAKQAKFKELDDIVMALQRE